MRVEEQIINTWVIEDGVDKGRVALRLMGSPQVVVEDGEIVCGVTLTPPAARELAFQILEWAKQSEDEYGIPEISE